jgi:four helix bundle protein
MVISWKKIYGNFLGFGMVTAAVTGLIQRLMTMQDFKKLRVYEEAFRLSKDVFTFMEDKQMSYRAKEQLLASVSSICANLAEMGAMDSVPAQRQKLVTCIGEANESEFWLDLCNSLKIIPQREHLNFMTALVRIRSMLCKLKASIERGGETNDMKQ